MGGNWSLGSTTGLRSLARHIPPVPGGGLLRLVPKGELWTWAQGHTCKTATAALSGITAEGKQLKRPSSGGWIKRGVRGNAAQQWKEKDPCHKIYIWNLDKPEKHSAQAGHCLQLNGIYLSKRKNNIHYLSKHTCTYGPMGRKGEKVRLTGKEGVRDANLTSNKISCR